MEIEFDGIGNELELTTANNITDIEYSHLEMEFAPGGQVPVAVAYAP